MNESLLFDVDKTVAVLTINEENNPMFQINLMLGFKKIATEIGCKLKL